MKVKFEIRHFMIFFLTVLAIIGMFQFGFKTIFLHMFYVLAAVLVLDIIINYIKLRRFLLSPSTIITGLIVAELISFDQPLHIIVLAGVFAILSKHLIFYDKRHIFNPAAVGLFVASLIFGPVLSWWGLTNLWVVVLFGLIILYKLRKYELTISYLAAFVVLSAIYTAFNDTSFISNLNLINYYFVAFMIIEPITSPIKKIARIKYGVMIAIYSFVSILLSINIDQELIGLLIANAFSRFLDKRG